MRPIVVLPLLLLAACGPRIEPIVRQGERIPARSDEIVARAHRDAEVERQRAGADRDVTMAEALAGCRPEHCDAISRGEVALGMSEAQVLAATRTGPEAWEVRGTQRARVMSGRAGRDAPSDAAGTLALVSLRDGRVSSFTYREPQGFRTVATPADATARGRSAAQAEALLRQGDELTVAGHLDEALERYDRADILRPDHPETTLRIARTLDKALRPLEASMRYRLFLHQLELERIRAEGDAYAQLAGAIAHAKERIVVLERRR